MLEPTVARRSNRVGSPSAKGQVAKAKTARAQVTGDPDEALRAVEAGVPVVLVGQDAAGLGEAVSTAPDQGRREKLLAVVVGDPNDPAVMLAAEEMAGELWQWASRDEGRQAGGAGKPSG